MAAYPAIRELFFRGISIGKCPSLLVVYSLVSNLHQTQPRQIPAAVGVRVVSHAHVGITQDLSAKGVAPCQATQLRQELVAVDVVLPRRRHGPLECARIVFAVARGRNPLDAAQLREGVNTVGFERIDQLLHRVLLLSVGTPRGRYEVVLEKDI